LREQLETSLTCDEAERSLSRQLDGELPRADRGPLRAHLRQCKECSQLARSQRASRGALKALLGGIPVPASFLGGGSGATLGLAAKAAAVVCAGAVVGTGGYEVQHAIAAKSAARPAKPSLSRHVAGTRRAVGRPAPAAVEPQFATQHRPAVERATVSHARPAARPHHRAQGHAKRSIVASARSHTATAAAKVAAHRAAIRRAKAARAQAKLAKRQQRAARKVQTVSRQNHHPAPKHVKPAKVQK
jgi:hypothetical protein